MNKRRHHNNRGLRQIKRGKTQDQVEDMSKRIIGRKSKNVSSNPR